MVMVKIVKLLQWLGWVLNMGKCGMEPKQEFHWLVWNWNSVTMTVSLPSERRKHMNRLATRLKAKAAAKTAVPVRTLARVIGTLSATRLQHQHASPHLAGLNALKTAAVRAVG
jgi:hypothetical protein